MLHAPSAVRTSTSITFFGNFDLRLEWDKGGWITAFGGTPAFAQWINHNSRACGATPYSLSNDGDMLLFHKHWLSGTGNTRMHMCDAASDHQRRIGHFHFGLTGGHWTRLERYMSVAVQLLLLVQLVKPFWPFRFDLCIYRDVAADHQLA